RGKLGFNRNRTVLPGFKKACFLHGKFDQQVDTISTAGAIELKKTFMSKKPLGRKNYGSIPHLPNRRMGPADKSCHEGQARIATKKARDSNDEIIVQEKLDGSNVGIAKVDGQIVPLGRAGYRAETSRWKQHKVFADWALQSENRKRFSNLLNEG